MTEVQKLLDANLAEHAKDNKWQFPSILVSKPKSTDMRLCKDFRKLNSITPLNPQPPFNMDHFMCDLGKQGCKYFSVLDFKSAFNQVHLTPRSQEICTFTSPLGCIRLKTHLFKTSVIFLGMKISAEGIETIKDNIEKVKKIPLKNTQKSVRSFLGLCNYYRKHLKDYSILASPLYQLTKRQKGKFQLTKEAIESFISTFVNFPMARRERPPTKLNC